MTGYTVHTGSTKKFSTGWDRIFQGGESTGKAPQAAPKKDSAKSATKKSVPSAKKKTKAASNVKKRAKKSKE